MGASLQTSLSRVYGFRIIDSDSVETLLATSFARMMVSPGLAGAHVQPCPRNNIELRATSFARSVFLVRSKLVARSSRQDLSSGKHR
jgi:hypothetical protein